MIQLRSDANGLSAICASTESDFLSLGVQLNAIRTDADTLTEDVVALLAKDREQSIQGALKEIRSLAGEALRELDQRRSRLAGDLEGLTAIQADLNALCHHNVSFKQVARNLKMVGLNISIESARSELAKHNFQSLAEEITHLSQTVHEVAGHIRDDAGEAQKTMDAIHTEIGARGRHLEHLVGAVQGTVEHALVEVDNLAGLTLSALDGVAANAREIGTQVSHLVVGIQIHDNITQRAAHIRHSLDEAVDLLQTSTLVPLPPPALAAIYGKVYGINRIQVTHLQTIIDDVAETRDKSVAALDRLAEAVIAVARPEGMGTSDDTGQLSFNTAHSQHPVAVLQRSLEQLIGLFDEGLNDIRRLSEARELTSRTVAEMDRHIEKVRDINFEIRLKALNAVVKSTHMGDTGKAFEAIVKEMKALAEQSNATIGSVTEIMERISGASETMEQQAQSEGNQTESAGNRLRMGIDHFTSACQLFKTQSESAVEKGRRLQEKIIQARKQSDFFERMVGVCREHHDGLIRIKACLQPFADTVDDEWMAEEKSILERYTMQRERDAHLRAFGGEATQKEVLSYEEASPQQAFDDNVELF